MDSKTRQCHKVCSAYAGVLGRGGGGYWMGMEGPRLKWRAVDTVGLGFGVVGLTGAGGRQAGGDFAPVWAGGELPHSALQGALCLRDLGSLLCPFRMEYSAL